MVGAGVNSTLLLMPTLRSASGAGVPHWPCFIGSSMATSSEAGARSCTHWRNPAVISSGVQTSGGGGGGVVAAGAVAPATGGVAAGTEGGATGASAGRAIDDDGAGGAVARAVGGLACAAFAGGALTAGGATGAADCPFAGTTAREGRNASAITPANATKDIHEDTRLSVLSTDAMDAMLTCWSITAKTLCVVPCRSIDNERGENGIAFYRPRMKVRLHAPTGNSF